MIWFECIKAVSFEAMKDGTTVHEGAVILWWSGGWRDGMDGHPPEAPCDWWLQIGLLYSCLFSRGNSIPNDLKLTKQAAGLWGYQCYQGEFPESQSSTRPFICPLDFPCARPQALPPSVFRLEVS